MAIDNFSRNLRALSSPRPVRLAAAVLATAALSACGGSAPPAEVAAPEAQVNAGGPGFGAKAAPRYTAEEVDDEAARSEAAYGAGQAQAAPTAPGAAPKAAGSHGARESEGQAQMDQGSAPWRRPGLATQWGEQRDSQVREVAFFRQNPTAPAASLRVQYDDESGIQAATGRGHDMAYHAVFPLHGGDFVVRVEDSDSDPLPSLQAGGRNFVIGDEGDRYQIRIDNNTPGRFEIVASVDGLDVLDGGEAGFDKRGYLVSPWSSVTIEGFRDTYETVRAFRFGDVATSYAAQRGKARNIGVIGVAVFEEQGFYWSSSPGERWRRDSAEPFPRQFAPAP